MGKWMLFCDHVPYSCNESFDDASCCIYGFRILHPAHPIGHIETAFTETEDRINRVDCKCITLLSIFTDRTRLLSILEKHDDHV